DGLYILRVACHDAPGAVSLAISRGTSCGSGPRCLHGSAVSLWGVSRGHSLACRTSGPNRNRSVDLLSLADGVSYFDSLSSLVRRDTGCMGAASELVICRSEERRVGKECRLRVAAGHLTEREDDGER